MENDNTANTSTLYFKYGWDNVTKQLTLGSNLFLNAAARGAPPVLPPAAAPAGPPAGLIPNQVGINAVGSHQALVNTERDAAQPLMYKLEDEVSYDDKQAILKELVGELGDFESIVGRRVEKDPANPATQTTGTEIVRKLSELPIPHAS